MEHRLKALAAANDGVITTPELLSVVTERECRRLIRSGQLHRVWRGIYSVRPPLGRYSSNL